MGWKPDLGGSVGGGKLLFRASESPWSREEPVTPPNFGHGMLFRSFGGKLLMSIHSHRSVNGRTVRIPHLFEVDLSGDKLVVGKRYKP